MVRSLRDPLGSFGHPHCAGGIPNAIWFKKKLSAVRNDIFDGILEALAAGAIFAWLWPAAMDAAVPVGG